MAKYAIVAVLAILLMLGAWFPAKADENPIKRLPSTVACSSVDFFNLEVVRKGGIKILSYKKMGDEYLILYIGPENLRLVVARYNSKKDQVCIKEMEEGMSFDWKNIPSELLKLSGIRTYPA